MIWRMLLVLLGCGLTSQAFVFYKVGNNVLRWNVNAPGLSTNVVNPATRAIRYFIASDAYSNTNKTNEIFAIRAAFDQWQAIPGTNLRFEFAGLVSPEGLDTRYDNMNVVFWTKTSLRVAGGTENLDGRRAWTSVTYSVNGDILDADIVFNGIQFQWYTDFENPNSPHQFIEAIALHEIGHFVGLDHSPAGGATVLSGANGIATEAGLSADEIAGARFLNPATNITWASIGGTVRMNGLPVLGAMVVVEDQAGNVAGATVSDGSGAYLVPSLSAGTYRLRVCPLDGGSSGLLRGVDIAPDYQFAVTSFLPTTNLSLSLTAQEARVQDVNLTPGEPPIRILGISKPTPDQSAVTIDRVGVIIRQGQSNYFTGVISRSLKPDAVLSISGDGITVGPSIFLESRFGAGLHAIIARIDVSSNATPGLRSFIVTHPTGTAYANGYLEIARPVYDYNFDGLDDRFQRTYWSPWTTTNAAPAADPDGDGLSNRYEYRTATNPLDPNSWKVLLNLPALGRFGATLTWPADPGRKYELLTRTDLSPAGTWQPVGSVLTATNETMSVVDGNRQGVKFYRLRLVP